MAGIAQNIDALRSRIASAPTSPGVYRWYDKHGNVLYIGKAKNLRKRLRSYLRDKASRSKQKEQKLSPWKEMLCRQIATFDFTVTSNELEALILETNLIKEEKPKYNVLMKDDKNYVYVKVTVQDPYPRVEIVRRLEEEDHVKPHGGSAALRGHVARAEYFGPYLKAWETERTLEMLHEVFNYRACKRSLDVLNKQAQKEDSRSQIPDSKPCLDHHIGRCNGLCTGKVSKEEYRSRIEEILQFFRGNHSAVKARLKEMMQEAAKEKKFERAAKLRDTLASIETLEEQQVVSDTSGENTDIIGVALVAGKTEVVVLRERGGKVISEIPFSLSGQPENEATVLSHFLPQYYLTVPIVPETIVIGEDIEDRGLLQDWLKEKRGKAVSIVVPSRGKKAKLLNMAERNAAEKLHQQLASFEAEDARVKTALEQLKEALGLADLPKRIECYDISHLSGTETVGSMVVFIGGKPKKEHYRHFTLRTVQKGEIDDYKALGEVLRRRLRYLRDLDGEWKKRGVTLGKAKKNEQQTIIDIVRSQNALSDAELRYKDFTVARKDKRIIAFVRLVTNSGEIREMKSLWVDEKYRGNKLGHAVISELLRGVKKGKVYIILDPIHALEDYYAQAGFRHVLKAPAVLQEKTENFHKEHPDHPVGTIMVYDWSKHKADPSLTSPPDLLLLDGGKGQLGVGLQALKEAGLTIPCAALAKEKEEIFIIKCHPEEPRTCDGFGKLTMTQCAGRLEGPIPISEDARFLLQRARDEAHRFANSHREKRVKKAMIE